MADRIDPTDRRTIAAVILAAGSSRRFGEANKLLADVAGRPLIAHIVATFLSAQVPDIIVVTGPDPEAIQSALANASIRFVHNPNHLSGMGSSVATGIAALSDQHSGALVCPGDMPGISGSFVDELIGAFFAAGANRVIRPLLADGRPAHPVLWPARLFPVLEKLSGPEGGRQVLDALATDVMTLKSNNADAALDIDTQDDLDALRIRLQKQHSS